MSEIPKVHESTDTSSKDPSEGGIAGTSRTVSKTLDNERSSKTLDNERSSKTLDNESSSKALDKETSSKPSGVSPNLWEKFQALQKKRQDVTAKVSARRERKTPRQKINIGQDPDTTQPSHSHVDKEPSQSQTSRAASRKRHHQPNCTSSRVLPDSNSATEEDETAGWLSIKPYLGINDHLKGVDRGRHAPKTKLEEKIDEAVAEGDFEKAELLSDSLAVRDLGKNIADAIDAKKYSEKKQKEEEALKAKKKKKLFWGFDHKERWETKGNM